MVRFAIVYCRRFWTAPNVEATPDTALIAASIVLSVVDVPRLIVPTDVPRLTVETVIDSPSLAPTWKVSVADEFRTLMPLNCAVAPICSISDRSWLTSVWIAVWSVLLSVPLPYCTASSRMR